MTMRKKSNENIDELEDFQPRNARKIQTQPPHRAMDVGIVFGLDFYFVPYAPSFTME